MFSNPSCKFLTLIMLMGLLAGVAQGCLGLGEKTEEILSEPTEEETFTEADEVTSSSSEEDEYDAQAEEDKIQAALENLDLAACEDISNSNAREACLVNVSIELARKNQDASYCDALDEAAKTNCLQASGEGR